VQAQYTVPNNGGYVQPAPGYVAPSPGTPVPYGGSGAPNYPPPVYAPNNSPQVYAQPTPSPYIGNAPGIGAPPVYAAPGTAPLLPGYGSGGELIGQPPPPGFPDEEPTRDAVIISTQEEAQTGRFMVGVGVNSNAGVVGSIVLDEQNADLTRLPISWRDFIEGRAFRGAGQQFRLEAVPGTEVSRYSMIFRQPYLFDTRIQFGASGYYFQRFYRDWKEERLGGRVSLGYQFPYVPDLSVNTALRMEQVELSRPTFPTPPQLTAALGNSNLFIVENALVHDTRDHTFLATEGHRIMLGFDQAFGDYEFSRGTVEARQHFLLHERPDRSGRQVLTLMTQLGFSGDDTPIFENYFAGGYSSMRGFNFRGVGPYVGNVNVGGHFQWLNTVEYMFPISADDMLRAVVFCDFGTVEEDIELQGDNFRVAPGFGLRITVPAMGPAPIAIDFAIPVARADGDNIQNLAFYIGALR
jgi:outer membrane protein insertion porin family